MKSRIIRALVFIVPLSGVLAGFGGWTATCLGFALTGRMFATEPGSIGTQIFGALGVVFFGGVTLGAVWVYLNLVFGNWFNA